MRDDSDHRAALVAHGDQRPEIREAGGKLAGPVDRVEDPHPLPIGAFGSELLSNDSVPRLLLLDDAAQRPLHGAVEDSHRRPICLDLDLGSFEVRCAVSRACAASVSANWTNWSGIMCTSRQDCSHRENVRYRVQILRIPKPAQSEPGFSDSRFRASVFGPAT